MSDFKCPECGKGRMVPEVIRTHETRLGGLPFVIENAHIARCTHCAEVSVSGEELGRWRQVQRDQLASSSQIPRPRDVKRIRQMIGLSVAGLATLIGVTRQTVHAWERDDLGGVQLGPGALLLKLLSDELETRHRFCLNALVRAAVSRGQRVSESVLTGYQEQSDGLPQAMARRGIRIISTKAPNFELTSVA